MSMGPKMEKKMKIKEILVFTMFSITIILPVSCGDEYIFATDADCNTCISPKPEDGPISINLSLPQDDKGVLLKVYKGVYTESMMNSDSQIIFNDTVKSTPFTLEYAAVNEYYSAVVEYISDGKKIKVVDGSELKLYSVSSTCNADCWIYKGGTIDCTLKFK